MHLVARAGTLAALACQVPFTHMRGMDNQHTVFITGATAGIGLACAKTFAAQGARLILVGRRQERLGALALELGVPCHALALDVRDGPALRHGVETLPPEFAGITILLNNAGLAMGLSKAQQAVPEEWDAMVDTNIKGVLHATQAILPGMVQRGRGHIINLGSVAGTYPYPGGNVYAATKAFVHQFSLSLKADLLGTPVRSTTIEPGMVETEFSTVRFGGDQEKAAAVYQGMKPLSSQDIADTVLWVASRPAHVNINSVELMPVDQAFSPFAVSRR